MRVHSAGEVWSTIALFNIVECSAFCDGRRRYVFMLKANFVKINLMHVVSVLVLDVCTGSFLFAKSTNRMWRSLGTKLLICYIKHSRLEIYRRLQTSALALSGFLSNFHYVNFPYKRQCIQSKLAEYPLAGKASRYSARPVWLPVSTGLPLVGLTLCRVSVTQQQKWYLAVWLCVVRKSLVTFSSWTTATVGRVGRHREL